MPLHAFGAESLRGKLLVLGIQLPYGNVLRRFQYESSQEAYNFCVNPSVSCPGIEIRCLPTKRWPNCMLESDMSRGRQAKTITKFTAGE